ncbi:hypothetical protein H9638_02180 [Arthrobacter sp. Sa2BUA2]|uniref:Uncharacterized protein n=1 Tax=Arthrobacter pullicola TaxID=2762224 RepID=A0ABR8YER0_9MICC|nr:hypothetical protein [Arthrobacter pullicola]MBD8042612.1 hypothetical protein [Arthrobacter pullicola]
MNWDWLRDVGWIGTTIVALGGLAATLWTSRRAGQTQLSVQNMQLTESRRVLEWQERKNAYAQFLSRFQEYFDKSIIQRQVDNIIDSALQAPAKSHTSPQSESRDSATDGGTPGGDRRLQVYEEMQEKFGVLTMQEGWALLTQLRDAANHARLIAPRPVRLAIDALMEAADMEKIKDAVRTEVLVRDFRAEMEARKLALNELMNEDLLSGSPSDR